MVAWEVEYSPTVQGIWALRRLNDEISPVHFRHSWQKKWIINIRMSSICHLHDICMLSVCHSYVNRRPLYVILMLSVYHPHVSRMPFICYLYVICMWSVWHPYVIRMTFGVCWDVCLALNHTNLQHVNQCVILWEAMHHKKCIMWSNSREHQVIVQAAAPHSPLHKT